MYLQSQTEPKLDRHKLLWETSNQLIDCNSQADRLDSAGLLADWQVLFLFILLFSSLLTGSEEREMYF